MIGYMCMTDYYHELQDASCGAKVFSSLEDLKEKYPCVEHCGIVSVEVTLKEVIQEEKFSWE